MNKQAPQLDTGPQLQPGEERRRSQRVIIRIPVTLEMMVSGKTVTIRAMTASVNDHGAMLVCTKNLPVDALFELINDRTAAKADLPRDARARGEPAGLSPAGGIRRTRSGFLAHLFPAARMEGRRKLVERPADLDLPNRTLCSQFDARTAYTLSPPLENLVRTADAVQNAYRFRNSPEEASCIQSNAQQPWRKVEIATKHPCRPKRLHW